MYFYVFWELIYFYVICIYVIWETTLLIQVPFDLSCAFYTDMLKFETMMNKSKFSSQKIENYKSHLARVRQLIFETI